MTSTNAVTESYEQRAARELDERRVRTAQFDALASLVAGKLGAEHEKREQGDLHLLTLKGRTFWLAFDRFNKRGRLEVSAKWPNERRADGSTQMVSPRDVGYGSQYDSPTITINPERGADAITKEITRRFLPTFTPMFDKCIERIAINEARGSAALTAARELGQRFHAKVEVSGDNAKLWIAGQHVSVGYSADTGATVYFSRGFSVSMDQAHRILKILSEVK